MEKQNDLNKINMDYKTYSKIKGKLNPQDRKNVTITGDKPTTSLSSMLMEENETSKPESIIKPQDKATIKYLSNVKDAKTGEISKPFAIGDKKYQMVRGVHPSGEVGLAVFCHDDVDDSGENMIHSVEYFEENIAIPMKEQMGMIGQDIKPLTEKKPIHSLSEFKHFIVNNKNGKVRKFKTIEELAKSNMTEEESYMNLPQFRKHVSEKLFGSKHRVIKEVEPTGNVNDEEITTKAKNLMKVIEKNSTIQTSINSIKNNPLAQREVIAAFAETIGVKRSQLPKFVADIKDIAIAKSQQQPQQQPQQQEPKLFENVIKIIKVKDINNE